MPSQWFRRALALWLPAAGASTVLAFALYGGVQQVERTDADDPQRQLARDAASALASGASPRHVTSGPTVDVVRSLAPWVTVYDADGTPLASSGSYLGKAPVIPDQARADARAGELSFTWEPVDGLRMATIVEPFPGGMVVAARSMQHEEEQQTRTLAIAAAAWIAALTAAGIGAALGVWVGDRAASSH